MINTEGIQMLTSTLAPKLPEPRFKIEFRVLRNPPGRVLAAQASGVLAIFRKRSSNPHKLLSQTDEGGVLHLGNNIYQIGGR